MRSAERRDYQTYERRHKDAAPARDLAIKLCTERVPGGSKGLSPASPQGTWGPQGSSLASPQGTRGEDWT